MSHIKFSHILCACLAVAMFPSCSDDDDAPVGDYITFTGLNTKIYNSKHEDYYGNIKFTTSGPWTATLTRVQGIMPDRWLTVTPMQGDTAGVYELRVTVAENASESERQAALTVTCGTATQVFYLVQREENSDYIAN